MVTSGYESYSAFAADYTAGTSAVTGIVYNQLPVLEYEKVNIQDLIDFVKDDYTQKLKRRLVVWQNNIETQIETGSIKISHLPDLIATRLDDYAEWIKKSELIFKYGIFESIMVVASHIVKGLTLVGLPDAIKGLIEFKKRELDLKSSELQAPGRELAYIFHANREFL